MKQWEEVERRADACNKTTTSFIRDKAVSSEVRVLDLKGLAPLINGMRTISNNINQIARKANETNNLYAGDVEKLRKEVECLSHTLSQFVSTLQWKKFKVHTESRKDRGFSAYSFGQLLHQRP